MSGIYIPGMEMPKNCGECLFAKLSPTGESLICNYMLSRVAWEERPFDCPLIPVPLHGRLIDADALEYHADNVRDPMGRTEKTVMWKKIESAPTIIPAEEGE